MTTKTAGTLATTTLTAVQFSPDPNLLANADLATIINGIRKDAGQLPGAAFGWGGVDDGGGNKPGTIQPGAFSRNGLLYLPQRPGGSPLIVRPGDWIAVDGFGNVFQIPQRAMPKTLTLANCTTVSGSPAVAFPSSVLALGWQNGTHITGTNVPTGSVLGDLTPNGLAANLYSNATPGVKVNATGSASNTTFTAGSWTHS